MSPELVAALVGAVAGGIIAVLGAIAQVFIQGWNSERGEITCDAAAKELTFLFVRKQPEYRDERDRKVTQYKFYSFKDARVFFNENAASAGWELGGIRYAFTANFLNTKGTNAAALEYSVRFLKGKRTVATSLPTVSTSVPIAEEANPGINLLPEQAVALPAENATGIFMSGDFSDDDANAAEKALIEADKIEFTVRLSTDKIIGVELDRFP
jgi:hypothetical protein